MNTTLLIMAAGIGSRFGTGIKQLEPVDDARKVSLKIDDYLFGVLGMDTEQASNEKREAVAAGIAKVVVQVIFQYSDEEISRFDEIIHSMAHLIIEFSQGGGFDNTDNQYG